MSYVSPFTGDVVQPTDVSYRSFSMSGNITLSWPINGNATGNYAARIMEVDALSGGLFLNMPPANQTSVGTDALILNVGSNTFTVRDNSNGTIIAIPAGQAQYIYVTTNATAAGTWGIIAFGAGSSGGNASSLAGLGLLAISSTLNQSHPVQSITTGYTFTTSDRAQAKAWNSGTGAATLPLASTLADNWFTIFKNNGTGTFTISTTGAETIDNGLTKAFQPGDSAIIICDGSEFITIGFGQSSDFIISVLVKNVTGGAYTLTASEASNIVQEYVGNLVSNVTVTYPPVVQLYIVSNQLVDNGYSLTLTTGIVGGANAIVPAGNQVTLICDGTNFLNANTVQAGASVFQLLNGTVTAPSLSFASETNTGVYRPAAGQFGISILGTQRVNVLASGIEVTGAGTFSNGISGGTFS